MILHTCTSTARLLRCLIAPRLRGIQSYCILVDGLIAAGIDRAHNLIVEHTLVVVHIAGIIRIKAVEVLRQLRQIIGAASLVERWLRALSASSPAGHIATHAGNLRVGLTEHLAIAHTSHRIAIAALNHRPEILCQIVVIRVTVAAIAPQRSRHHRYVLIGMTCADSVDIMRQRVEEGRAVEVTGSLQQTGFLVGVLGHLRESGQRLGHSSHLAGDIHVPHLIAIAGTLATLLLVAFALHIGAVVQAVPHPQSHILSNQQRLLGHLAVVDIGGDVDESGQLLVHRVVGSPHPIIIIVRAIHLY